MAGLAMQAQLPSLQKSIDAVGRDYRAVQQRLDQHDLAQQRAVDATVMEAFRVSNATGTRTPVESLIVDAPIGVKQRVLR